MRQPDGTLLERDRGTPQGSAVSPVLANLFLHYAFDMWMAREFPTVPFERYADDAVVHCVTERQARHVLAAIADRMEEVGLRLHPDKTKIVYCKDGNRRRLVRAHRVHVPGVHLPAAYGAGQERRDVRVVPARDQQGRPEEDQRRGPRHGGCTGGSATPSPSSPKRSTRSWRAGCSTTDAFYRSALNPLLERINAYLVRWIRKKYKRLRGTKKSPRQCWRGITARYPRLFAHWKWVLGPAAGDQDDKSRMIERLTYGSVGAGG